MISSLYKLSKESLIKIIVNKGDLGYLKNANYEEVMKKYDEISRIVDKTVEREKVKMFKEFLLKLGDCPECPKLKKIIEYNREYIENINQYNDPCPYIKDYFFYSDKENVTEDIEDLIDVIFRQTELINFIADYRIKPDFSQLFIEIKQKECKKCKKQYYIINGNLKECFNCKVNKNCYDCIIKNKLSTCCYHIAKLTNTRWYYDLDPEKQKIIDRNEEKDNDEQEEQN